MSLEYENPNGDRVKNPAIFVKKTGFSYSVVLFFSTLPSSHLGGGGGGTVASSGAEN